MFRIVQLAQQKISDQEAKIVDLNWQVRHELTRNEGIEKVRSRVSENTSKLANVKKINIRCYVTFSLSFNFLLVQRAFKLIYC